MATTRYIRVGVYADPVPYKKLNTILKKKKMNGYMSKIFRESILSKLKEYGK